MSQFQNLKLINNSVSANIFDNMLAFYNFDGNILDSIGTISPLVTGGSCSFSYTSGISGTSAIQFNNFGTCFSGAGLFCPNDVWNLYQGNTKASFSFWFRYTQNIPLLNPNSSTCGMSFFGCDFGRFGFGVAPIAPLNLNRIHCYIGNNPSGRYIDPLQIVVGEWNHIAGSYDNTTRNFKVYRNGNLVHNYTYPSAIVAPIENPNFYKGFGINGSGYIGGEGFVLGTGEYGIPIDIDSVGLWNRILTDQEVSFLYNSRFSYSSSFLPTSRLNTIQSTLQEPFDRNDSDMILWLRTDYGLTFNGSNYVTAWLDYSSANNHCNSNYFGAAKIEGYRNNIPYVWTDRDPSKNNYFYRIDNPSRTSNSDNFLSVIGVYKTNNNVSFNGFTENGPIAFGNDTEDIFDGWGSFRGFGFDEYNQPDGEPGLGFSVKGPSTFIAPLSYFQPNRIYTFVIQFFENTSTATVHIDGQQYGGTFNLQGFPLNYSSKRITEWVSGALNPSFNSADGGLFEVLAFRRALSANEITNFQNYVYSKYDLIPLTPTPTPTPTPTITVTPVTPTPTPTPTITVTPVTPTPTPTITVTPVTPTPTPTITVTPVTPTPTPTITVTPTITPTITNTPTTTPPPTWDVGIQTANPSETFSVNIYSGTSPNIRIDWGDGTVETFTTTGTKTRTYATAGNYTVKISGGFTSNGNIRLGNTSIEGARVKSTSVIPTIPGLTSFDNTFSSCTSLSSIPAGLFDNNTAVTSFVSTFTSCTSLSSIPAGLFDNNTAVTSFGSTFTSCTSLTSIPSTLFANNTAVTNFFGTFGSCTSLTSIPSTLFANNTAVTNFVSTFNSCTSLTSIPSTLFANNTAVTSFGNTFTSCTSLTSIPSTLFANNTAVTNFVSTFFICNSLTSIPSGLFANNTAVTDFFGTFSSCTSLTSIPSGLFDNNTAVTSFVSTFTSCTSLTSIPSTLFANNTAVTNFGNTFVAVTLTTTSYSNLLINMASNAASRKNNVQFGGGNSKYNTNGQTARNTLIAKNWTFIDGGLEI
jgi:hypothetical protein